MGAGVFYQAFWGGFGAVLGGGFGYGVQQPEFLFPSAKECFEIKESCWTLFGRIAESFNSI